MATIDLLGPESKQSLLLSAITADDLIDKVDFSNSINKENTITTIIENGKYITKIRIPNNVEIYKSDLQEKPLLLDIISPSDIINDSIPLSSFDLNTQSKIALIFMQYYGYVKMISNEYYFTEEIEYIFNTDFWSDIFTLARQKTLDYIQKEVDIGNQPVKNKDLIENSKLISVEQFKTIQPSYKCDTLWALSIYFFDKIIRNWNDQIEKEIMETTTIMDIDIGPSKYNKLLDPKVFFLMQLRLYLSSRPDYVFFGGNYFSKFKEFLQMKPNSVTQTIIMEELEMFTNAMNELYANSTNTLSGTEPFKVVEIRYSEVEDGPYVNIIMYLVLLVNTYKKAETYTLPISTRVG